MNPILIAANCVGYIGVVIVWYQVIFGSRHVFKYITKDTVLINKIHKQIGIYGFLLIFVHPLLEMMSRLESLLWIVVPDFSIPTATYITLGKISFIMLAVVWVTSAIVREKIKWSPWKYIHLLSYGVVFLTFIHIKFIGTFYEDYIGIRIAWLTMLILFLVVIILRLSAYASLLKNKSVITEMVVVNGSILVLTIKPTKKIFPEIGQHIYIQSAAFKSEHPFTVMENHQEEGKIVLGIRKFGSLWDELMAKKIGDNLYIDGPYGVFTKEAQNANQKVIISGGIGVTPFVDLVNNFGTHTTYINCNRSIDDAVNRSLLKEKSDRYIDIVDSYQGVLDDTILVGRISKEIIGNIVGVNSLSLPYFVCGSPMFITIVKGMLLEMGVPKKSIYFEALGF